MNEQIEKLIEQAIIQNEPDWIDIRKALTGSGSLYLHVFAEKFAQLIVRECISMADKESERYSGLDQEYCAMAMDNYRELVRQHFGVEQ